MNAFIQAAQHENISGNLINIGNGKGISIKDLIYKCAEILKIKNININVSNERNRPEKAKFLILYVTIQPHKKRFHGHLQYPLLKD